MSVLTTHFTYLSRQGQHRQKKASSQGNDNTEVSGEYASLMEQELFDFILFEVPSVV
jgi:V-type H+-transporting ATPase subunit C